MKFYFTIYAICAGLIIAIAIMVSDVMGQLYSLLYLPLLAVALSIANSHYGRKVDVGVIIALSLGSFLVQFVILVLLFFILFQVGNFNEHGLGLIYILLSYLSFLFFRKALWIEKLPLQDFVFLIAVTLSSLVVFTPHSYLFFLLGSIIIGICFDIPSNNDIYNSSFQKIKSGKMQTENAFFATVSHWLKTSVTFKMIVVGMLMIMLIVPMFFVSNLIIEREELQQEAIHEIGSKWGADQFLVGPILAIPYKERINSNGKETDYVDNAYFLPENLNISGMVNPETLYRGIYDVTVYNAELNYSGKFTPPDLNTLRLEKENMMWEDAFICFGISDMKGIRENIKLRLDDRDLNFSSGINGSFLKMTGVSAYITKENAGIIENGMEFAFKVDVNGSSALNFAPLGEETGVNLSSSWVNPGFDGSFLPDKREITENGFNAEWKVLNLNRGYPQEWKSNKFSAESSFFGVNLLQPVEQYHKISRSAKYAFLFIFLTFVIFFFVEVINKTRIHPIRYLLVGLALIIFYTLLLSISEVIGFENAYLTASSAVVILITLYSKNFLKKWFLTISMFFIFSALYGFLFFTIQLQDYSLLAGSIGLFIILAILMYFSRKINYEKDNIEKIPEPQT